MGTIIAIILAILSSNTGKTVDAIAQTVRKIKNIIKDKKVLFFDPLKTLRITRIVVVPTSTIAQIPMIRYTK
jgi:hypothetical protein